MEASSPRFKSLAVTAGASFWYFIIITSLGHFTIEIFLLFIAVVLTTTQIFANKISKGLNIVAIINTKIFLGILFVSVISIYGVIFKILRIDLLRVKKQQNSYWLEMDETNYHRIWKQY